MTDGNPYAATLTDERQMRRWPVRASSVLSFVVCTLPLIGYIYTCVFWLTASVMRGEWAAPGRPDPKTVAFGLPLMVHFVITILSVAIGPVVVAIGWSKRKPLYILLYLCCFIASIALFRLDMWQIASWIAD